MFANEGVDIYHLDHAYDYTAYDKAGNATEWTMLPPVVEVMQIPRHDHGGFDYVPLIGPTLTWSIKANGWALDKDTTKAQYHNENDTFHLINDGSHRVHAGYETGKGVSVMTIRGMTPGFPYYAVPHHYSKVQVFPNKESSKDMKVHVVTPPGHKQLYRLFPSGGILSGTVRQARPGEMIA